MLQPNWAGSNEDQQDYFIHGDYAGVVTNTDPKRWAWFVCFAIYAEPNTKPDPSSIISRGASPDKLTAQEETRIELERILAGESQGGTKSRGG